MYDAVSRHFTLSASMLHGIKLYTLYPIDQTPVQEGRTTSITSITSSNRYMWAWLTCLSVHANEWLLVQEMQGKEVEGHYLGVKLDSLLEWLGYRLTASTIV